MREMDHHLAVDAGRVVCRSCVEDGCTADKSYKLHALYDCKPLTEAGPLVNDPSEYVDDEMEVRQFYCPGCGTLLENEVIEADQEPVHDKQLYEQ